MPSSMDAASFIYPLTAGATSLPEPLLQYLQDQAPFAAQFSGQAITGCAGLDYVPPEITSSVTSSSIAEPSASLTAGIPTASSWSNQTYTRTTRIRTGGPTRLTPPGETKTSTYNAPPESSEVPPAPYSSPKPTTNSHSTAFVIQPVTASSQSSLLRLFLPVPTNITRPSITLEVIHLERNFQHTNQQDTTPAAPQSTIIRARASHIKSTPSVLATSPRSLMDLLPLDLKLYIGARL